MACLCVCLCFVCVPMICCVVLYCVVLSDLYLFVCVGVSASSVCCSMWLCVVCVAYRVNYVWSVAYVRVCCVGVCVVLMCVLCARSCVMLSVLVARL